MANKVCAIIGVGPGNGEAYARRFAADGYAVALMARSADKLDRLAAELDGARAYACDAADPDQVTAALAQAAQALGAVDVLLYNAGSGIFGAIDEIELEAMEMAWRVNTLGLAVAARAVAPAMLDKGSGTIFITGATASLRGGAGFAGFAQAKAAQRSLAQSMARLWGPKGLHVAYMIIDGVVDGTPSRQLEAFKDKPADAFLKPEDIADTVHFICHQPRSAWTFEYDVRPFCERW
ncbi:MAG: SDR family NAD(P)-dependent oxidoreductase [Rhodothalassiaceae bacterium]